MILWRVTDGERMITDYIRSNNMDEAGGIFKEKHNRSAVEFQPTDEKIQAVYFTDAPSYPAFFKGTKTEARKSGNLYIRQWQLNAQIDRIETI